MTTRDVDRATRISLLLLLAGALLVFAEILFGRVPAMRDFVGFTYPSRAVWREGMTSADFSTWNPLAALGMSRLASPHHGLFYPGNLLLLIGSVETGVALTWGAHVLLAGLGGYCLARGAGARPIAAVVSGALWAFGGYAVSMWWNGEKVLSSAWLPWFAWAALRTARNVGRSPFDAAALAVATAMICYAGDPFLLFHAVGLAVALFLAEPTTTVTERLAGWGRMGAGLVLGLGLAAPVLLPVLLMRGDTPRGEALSATLAETWSLHPARIAELFLPGWFGSPFDVARYPGASFAADPNVQVLPWAVSIYVGAAVLVFAPWARSRRALVSLGGTALLFVLLALGQHTPVHAIARAVVPGLSLLRYPEKHLVVAIGLLGVLAALGMDRVLSERPRWGLGIAPAAVVMLGVVLAPAPLRVEAQRAALHAWVAATCLVAALWLASRKPRLAFAVTLVSVLDLAVAGRPFLRWVAPPVLASEFAEALKERRGKAPPRLYRPHGGDFEAASTLPESAAQAFGVAVVPGFEPARSLRLDLLIKALESRPGQLAALFALDAVLVPADVRMQLPARVSTGGWSLYLLPPLPRAWIVASIERADAASALRIVASAGFDPYAEAVVTTGDDREVRVLEGRPKKPAGECQVVEYARSLVELDCQAREAGLVVSSELDADGWSAFVDGEKAPLYTADLALRGVKVNAGRHRVTARYETPGLTEGWMVAALSVLVLAAGVLSWRRRRSQLS